MICHKPGQNGVLRVFPPLQCDFTITCRTPKKKRTSNLCRLCDDLIPSPTYSPPQNPSTQSGQYEATFWLLFFFWGFVPFGLLGVYVSQLVYDLAQLTAQKFWASFWVIPKKYAPTIKQINHETQFPTNKPTEKEKKHPPWPANKNMHCQCWVPSDPDHLKQYQIPPPDLKASGDWRYMDGGGALKPIPSLKSTAKIAPWK